MKFEIETKKLSDILKAVSTATPKKTKIEELQSVKIEVIGDAATFYCTDLYRAFSASARVRTTIEGSALASASQLLKLIKAVKTDHIWIELREDRKLTIGPSFSMKAGHTEEYPEPNDEEKGSAITVSSQELNRLIDDVKHCAAKDQFSVQGYAGIFLQARGSAIVSAAQDGWRLAESKIGTDPGQDQWQKLFPQEQIKFMQSALPKKETDIRIQNAKERLYLSWLDGDDAYEVAVFADSDMQFMDYSGFFPEDFETQSWAPKKDLLEAIKTVAVVAKEQPKGKNAQVSYGMFFEVKDGKLQLSAEACGMEAQESIKIDGNSDFEVGLNCVFLEEMIKSIDSEVVAFSCSGPEMPVYLWPDNQYEYRRQVVMSLTMR